MIICKQQELNAFCAGLKGSPFITVDTEFMRERTYYPLLCLVQVSGPDGKAAAIDPIDGADLDLSPLFELMNDPAIVKVFHAGRQDLEIFHNLTGKVVQPLFDTQVAAMVCGYGDQIGYTNLVSDICKHTLDKAVQFTDWSKRPLSKRQIDYALCDVTYLIDVYKHLAAEIELRGRKRWLEQEETLLLDPRLYETKPEDAWQRIKIRTDKPVVLSVLRELAAWREREAQERNIPRGWLLRDETLADIAVHMPDTPEKLSRARGIAADMANGKMGKRLLEAVALGKAVPKAEQPRAKTRKPQTPAELTPIIEMLRMLLRIECARHEVVPKIVASPEDLEALAMDDEADIPALKGWRLELFGRKALELKRGKLALRLDGGTVDFFEVAAS